MAENTKIQWTDHTINFWTGCKKVSDGCKFCYMYRDKERYKLDPSEVIKTKPNTVNKVLKVAKPGDKIFVNSWSDFFIEEADSWREEAWNIIRSRPDLIWQILTKRPERIEQCLPDDWEKGWDNVWLGVSAENDKNFRVRSQILCEIPATVRFISAEPLLGPIYMENLFLSYYKGIDWVIMGGESGNDNGKYKYRPAELSWFQQIIDDCQLHEVRVFMKQTGTYLAKRHSLSDRHGGNINDFPDKMRIRQFP
jgi:protein gp37